MIAEKARLKIASWMTTAVNGGSVAVAFAHESSPLPETVFGRHEPGEDWGGFRERVAKSRDILRDCIGMLKGTDARIIGYGASTKGNVLLQYTGVGADLDCIAEVNADKVGRVTPGTNIPIVSELEARRRGPDAFLVLPWHFRDYIVEKEKRCGGPDLIFPLPQVEVVRAGRTGRAGG